MKQKYLIMKNNEKDELIIRELGELEKETYSLLCEEKYDSKKIEFAISEGKSKLISTLRTENLFPIGKYAEKIAEAVAGIYISENNQSMELFFNDTDLLAKTRKKPKIVDALKDEASGIDDLFEEL